MLSGISIPTFRKDIASFFRVGELSCNAPSDWHFFLSVSRLTSLTVCGSNSCNGKRLSFSPKRVQTVSGAHPASSSRAAGCFPGVKRSGRECSHVSLSSAEVKNEWNCSSAPKCFLDISRDTLGFVSWFPVQTKQHLPTGLFSLRQELCTHSADQLRAPIRVY